jgi:uncharacterized coiled-coil DUF342 family protein
MDVSQIVALLTAIAGLGGITLAIWRLKGEGSDRILTQQTTILGDMKVLNDELKGTLDSTRSERDQLMNEVQKLREEVTKLRQLVDRRLDLDG